MGCQFFSEEILERLNRSIFINIFAGNVKLKTTIKHFRTAILLIFSIK